jgi:hypothetical protein
MKLSDSIVESLKVRKNTLRAQLAHEWRRLNDAIRHADERERAAAAKVIDSVSAELLVTDKELTIREREHSKAVSHATDTHTQRVKGRIKDTAGGWRTFDRDPVMEAILK